MVKRPNHEEPNAGPPECAFHSMVRGFRWAAFAFRFCETLSIGHGSRRLSRIGNGPLGPPYALLTLLVAAIVTASTGFAQDDEEETFVVIRAGRVITVSGEEHIRAEIVLVDGKVRLVGKALDYPKSAKVIDARREVVMPGMIHPRTRWQLPRYTRTGLHGDRSAAKEVYLDQIDFDPFVKAGFTAVCFYPYGTGVTGPSAVYRTAGEEKSRDLGSAYLRITMSSPGRDKKTIRGAIDKAKKEIEKVDKARKEWEEKQKKAKEEAAKKAKEKPKDGGKPKEDPKPAKDAEKKTPAKKEGEEGSKDKAKKPDVFTPPKIDPAVLPFVKWIRDKKGPPLLFELNRASDLRHLDDAVRTAFELPATLLYLARSSSPDYHHVIKDLVQREATVLVTPRIGNLPYTVTRYNLAAELAVAGCEVVLVPTSDSTSGLKDFRVRLAELVHAGLPRGEALKAVTAHPAKALGVADRLGTIEKGKDADFVFLDGDPLNPHTRITRVMTLGEIVWEAPRKP